MNYAPIVLFVYNRPLHTEQTLNALMQNELADQSVLYIYSDGPKENTTEEQLKKIQEVRRLLSTKKWCKEVHIIEAEKNKGLADSIIDGVTEIVNKYGKIIVLEDDLVTSIGFLKYMNDALDLYEFEEKVMHISGYMFPVKKKLPKTFFYKPTSCWGWATWSRAWKHFKKNAQFQIDELEKTNSWEEFTIDFSYPDFKNQLVSNLEGKINTWAIFWQSSVFLAGGTSLHPYPSLVQNIGFDGSGVHCENATNFKHPFIWNVLAKNIPVKKRTDFYDLSGHKAMQSFFLSLDKKRPFLPNVKRAFKRILNI